MTAQDNAAFNSGGQSASEPGSDEQAAKRSTDEKARQAMQPPVVMTTRADGGPSFAPNSPDPALSSTAQSPLGEPSNDPSIASAPNTYESPKSPFAALSVKTAETAQQPPTLAPPQQVQQQRSESTPPQPVSPHPPLPAAAQPPAASPPPPAVSQGASSPMPPWYKAQEQQKPPSGNGSVNSGAAKAGVSQSGLPAGVTGPKPQSGGPSSPSVTAAKPEELGQIETGILQAVATSAVGAAPNQPSNGASQNAQWQQNLVDAPLAALGKALEELQQNPDTKEKANQNPASPAEKISAPSNAAPQKAEIPLIMPSDAEFDTELTPTLPLKTVSDPSAVPQPANPPRNDQPHWRVAQSDQETLVNLPTEKQLSFTEKLSRLEQDLSNGLEPAPAVAPSLRSILPSTAAPQSMPPPDRSPRVGSAATPRSPAPSAVPSSPSPSPTSTSTSPPAPTSSPNLTDKASNPTAPSVSAAPAPTASSSSLNTVPAAPAAWAPPPGGNNGAERAASITPPTGISTWPAQGQGTLPGAFNQALSPQAQSLSPPTQAMPPPLQNAPVAPQNPASQPGTKASSSSSAASTFTSTGNNGWAIPPGAHTPSRPAPPVIPAMIATHQNSPSFADPPAAPSPTSAPQPTQSTAQPSPPLPPQNAVQASAPTARPTAPPPVVQSPPVEQPPITPPVMAPPVVPPAPRGSAGPDASDGNMRKLLDAIPTPKSKPVTGESPGPIIMGTSSSSIEPTDTAPEPDDKTSRWAKMLNGSAVHLPTQGKTEFPLKLALPAVLVIVVLGITTVVLKSLGSHPPVPPGLEKYSEAIKENPQDASVYAERGAAAMGQREYAQAESDFAEAKTLQSDNDQYTLSHAAAAFNLQQYDKAFSDYDGLLSRNANDTRALFGRGLAHAKLNKLNDAVVDLNQTIKLNPNYAPAYTELSAIYTRMNHPTLALGAVDHAIKLEPNAGVNYFNKATILRQLQKPTDALANYTTAIGLTPGRPEFLNDRGFTYLELGRKNEAIQDFKAALAINPKFKLAERNLADAEKP